MGLPEEIVSLFNNPAARKTLSTVDEHNTIHAAPFASLAAAPDGSMITLAQVTAEETPKRLKYMKKTDKAAVVVVQYVDLEKMIRKGYSVRCRVGDALTSGTIYDKVAAMVQKSTGTKPKAVWTLYPISYKVHTPGPERGKTVTLE